VQSAQLILPLCVEDIFRKLKEGPATLTSPWHWHGRPGPCSHEVRVVAMDD